VPAIFSEEAAYNFQETPYLWFNIVNFRILFFYMTLKGVVFHSNDRKRMIAVKLPSDLCSVIKIPDEFEVNPGDILEGELNSEGTILVNNLTQNTRSDVFVQQAKCSQPEAMRILILK
jgi:hypothetical protein